MIARIERDRADPRRRAAETRGRRAEAIAALYLRLKFYRVLARRYRTPVGEIDLIVKRGRTIAFVEVKNRPDPTAALEAVSRSGRRRIARAAGLWLAAHPDAANLDLRFDLLVIVRFRLPRHVMSVFDAEGRP
jgi:putative endonuclease